MSGSITARPDRFVLKPWVRPASVPLLAAAEAAVTLRTGAAWLSRLRPLPEAAPVAGRVPLVLVHGLLGSPDVLRPIARTALRAGTPEVIFVRYPSLQVDLEGIAERVGAAIREAAVDGPVDALGHSIGAVAIRAWVKTMGGAPYVRRFVSLGGPHGGTSLWRVAPPRLRAALRPDGPWVRRLAEGPEPVPTVVIRSSWDQQVVPPVRARIDGVREVIIKTRGHNGLLWARSAHEAVLEALAPE